MFVYVIVCSENLKLYVGQHKGIDLLHYLQQKMSEARRKISFRSRLYAAMRKHPRDSWSIHPLVSDVQTRAELDELERHFIRVLKTQNPEIGYNLCAGGEGFTGPHSEDTKIKLQYKTAAWWASQTPEARHARGEKSASKTRGIKKSTECCEAIRKSKVGLYRSPETIARYESKLNGGRSLRGRKQSAEFVEKRVAPLRGRKLGPSPLRGIPKSAEICAKVSAGKAREWAARNNRRFSPARNAKISETMKGKAPLIALQKAHSPETEKKRQDTRFMRTVAWG